ncbi:MAG TPA: ChbG/HpnK family deacetylase [Thermoguttaceae bacterium]|nr:ChbG/HpnK family deacetylase [Thermoguttaceae bacterium]
MKQLIINGDDLGICEATNLAIAEAFRHGVLTSTSLMANGPAFEHAVREVVRANPSLGVGLHLCLTSGLCVAPAERVSLLVDKQGRFRRGFLSLCLLAVSRPARALSQIETEFDAQFRRVKAAGVSIDHVDSHRHVHMIPPIFRIASTLARRHGCSAIRMSHEPLPPLRQLVWPGRAGPLMQNLPKKIVLSTLARWNRGHAFGLAVPSRAFGILDSGNMNRNALERIFGCVQHGATEIIVHPGNPNPNVAATVDGGDRVFLESVNRQAELSALVDSIVAEAVNRNELSLVRHSDLRSEIPELHGGDGATYCLAAGRRRNRLL